VAFGRVKLEALFSHVTEESGNYNGGEIIIRQLHIAGIEFW
jgi:hypothetical protein